MVIKIGFYKEQGGDTEMIIEGPVESAFGGFRIEREANGGISIFAQQEDEFGDKVEIKVHLDQFDIQLIDKV